MTVSVAIAAIAGQSRVIKVYSASFFRVGFDGTLQ
jgi:hypothetical protein